MQVLREELKKKDDESLKKQREYEAKIQEIEARLRQATESRSHPGAEYPEQWLDRGLQLISPDAEAELNAAAKKQRTLASRSLEGHDVETGNPWLDRQRDITFRHEEYRTADLDIEMTNNADCRDAGTAQQEAAASPQPVVRLLTSDKAICND
jgi:hypothetical protein